MALNDPVMGNLVLMTHICGGLGVGRRSWEVFNINILIYRDDLNIHNIHSALCTCRLLTVEQKQNFYQQIMEVTLINLSPESRDICVQSEMN